MSNPTVRAQHRIDAEFYEKVRELAHKLRISRNSAFEMLAKKGYAVLMDERDKAA